MFLVNVGFCCVALVLLTLLTVEAECTVSRGHMLADAEIALKQPAIRAAHLRSGTPESPLRASP